MEKQDKTIKQLSIPAIFSLHLFPGLVILLVTILFASPYWGLGLPVFLSLLLAIFFGLIPAEMGILYFVAWKQNKKIGDIIGFTTKTSAGKTLLWTIPCFVIAIISFGFIKETEHRLLADFFSWVPAWFRIDVLDIGSNSLPIIWMTIILNFILNGILGPLVEELYFRGYLLPRMNRLGKWAPLVNTLLFSLHCWCVKITKYQQINHLLVL